MRVLVVIVHHWNPKGSGRHQSLQADASPRVAALRKSILAFSRMGRNQFYFNFADKAAYRANFADAIEIDIHVITDGHHHVLNKLPLPFRKRLRHIKTEPEHPLKLGFEAQRHLGEQLNEPYDLYAYFEDDLIVHDPQFFLKINGFNERFGDECVLLPQRYELLSIPAGIDKLYIDGVISEDQLSIWIPEKADSLCVSDLMVGDLMFTSPPNPHSGCFVLTRSQLERWSKLPWWLDRDCSFVSPLESAATLGLLKTFKLYKPCFPQAYWLEIQHSGTSFLGLMANAKSQPFDGQKSD